MQCELCGKDVEMPTMQRRKVRCCSCKYLEYIRFEGCVNLGAQDAACRMYYHVCNCMYDQTVQGNAPTNEAERGQMQSASYIFYYAFQCFSWHPSIAALSYNFCRLQLSNLLNFQRVERALGDGQTLQAR